MFDTHKTTIIGLLWKYVKRFSQNTGTQRTDRQTDGRTDGQNCYINIARQYADAR